MSKQKTIYECSECGHSYPKWAGQCVKCLKWDTIEEQSALTLSNKTFDVNSFEELSFVDLSKEIEPLPRYHSNIKEFDRVCGGGIVSGSAILVAGDPGIGKSTLLLQIVASLCKKYDCLYISGEESVDQIKMRAIRLNVLNDNLKIANTNSLNTIVGSINKYKKKPDIIIIDSIQTLYTDAVQAIPGSISQVKTCASSLVSFCKKFNIALIMIGHVTREGQIAGPKVLEHLVDCVLYFEGEKNNNFRIIRSIKNRFGSTDELGIFEMSANGLVEVENPSAIFLENNEENVTGTAVFSSMEGSRPLLVEVQVLISKSTFATPKRSVIGTDSNRLSMILAVLETRLGINVFMNDIYLNIAGGIKIKEPSIDLPICAALMSCVLDKPLPLDTIFFGEISLSGQIKKTHNIENRLNEAYRTGFKTAIIPKLKEKEKKLLKQELLNGIKIIEVKNIKDLINIIKHQ